MLRFALRIEATLRRSNKASLPKRPLLRTLLSAKKPAALGTRRRVRAFLVIRIIMRTALLCKLFMIGIPFAIPNYFCGDKPIYAALNAARSTPSTTSGVCLA